MEETQIMAITVEQILAEDPDGRRAHGHVNDHEHDWELIYDKRSLGYRVDGII